MTGALRGARSMLPSQYHWGEGWQWGGVRDGALGWGHFSRVGCVTSRALEGRTSRGLDADRSDSVCG
jgi:hypothetical protein